MSCLVAFKMGYSQSPACTNYNSTQGLASSTVYGGLQDQDGYIWFCTESGASRFDGTSFQNFTVQDGLSGNDVLSMFQDSKGRIWFFPFNGYVSYYENGSIHNKETDPWLAVIKGQNFIATVFEDDKGVIWMVDDDDMVFRVLTDNQVIANSPLPANMTRRFRAIYANAKGTTMAFSHSGIRELGSANWVSYLEDSLSRWSATRLTTIGVDSQLCAIGSNLVLIHEDRVQILKVDEDLFGTEALSVDLDLKGNLWFGTRDGAVKVSEFAITGGTFVIGKMTRFLPKSAISRVINDHEGNYWMTSLDGGVFFFPSISATTFAVETSPACTFANHVFIDKRDRVWFGFDGSVYGELLDGTLKAFSMPYGNGGRGRTNDIFEDLEGNIIFILDHSMAIIKPNGEHLHLDIGSKAGLQGRDGVYYMSHGYSADTVSRFAMKDFSNIYRTARNDTFAIVKRRTICFQETKKGTILLGTLVGLWEWNGVKPRQITEVPDYSISDIIVTKEGIVWISSLAQGVGYLYEDHFIPVTEADGLASDICLGLALDENGVVFVATHSGISRIEVSDYPNKRMVIRNFGKNFGLASDEVRSVAVRHGKIYAATSAGLSVLQEDFLTAIPPKVPIHITTFTVDGNAVTPGNGPLVISHRQNNISISFTGISFRNADKLQFAYRLSNGEEDTTWIPTASRQLEFPALPPGNYRLSLRATIDGLPATAGVTHIEFVVMPAFWETGWFIVALIIVGVLLVALLFYLAFQRLKRLESRRNEIAKRIAVSEQKALRSQMNPHFIFNSLNSIEKFFITGRPQEANAFIADFSDLIRSILDLSGKTAITLREELRFVELFLTLESHRMDHRFSFVIEVDASLSQDNLVVPPIIVQPFAENAVWHGVSSLERGGGLIKLRVEAAANGLKIIIQDNGIGRIRSQELKSKYRAKHKSSGVRITTERLELLNLDLEGPDRFAVDVLDLYADDGAAIGTSVVIFVPNSFSKSAV